MKARRIAILNLSETTRDPRVKRIASSLANQGHQVTVYGIQSESQRPRESHENFEIVRIPLALNWNSRQATAVRTYCRSVTDLIDECDGRVIHPSATEEIKSFAFRLIRRFVTELRSHEVWERGDSYTKYALQSAHEIASIRHIVYLNLAIAQRVECDSPEIIHCNDLDTLIAGSMIKFRLKIPLVYDAHEIYSEQFEISQRSDIWHNFYCRLESQLLKLTDGRLTVCDSLGDYFQEHYKCDRFETVLNVPSIQHLPHPHVLLRNKRPRLILYHGMFFVGRGIEDIIDAAKQLDEGQFILRGFGPLERSIRERIRDKGLSDRITVAPSVGVDELIGYASQADIGLNPFVPNCINTQLALPNKFFEYMMSGLCIISSDLPELSKLTVAHNLGRLAKPQDPESLAEQISSVIKMPDALDLMRRNSYEAARSQFNWEAVETTFLRWYSDFCA